jgi:phosphohistidine phosphatase
LNPAGRQEPETRAERAIHDKERAVLMPSKEAAITETPEKEDAGRKEESSPRYGLYIMRHGIAVARGSHFEDDSKRPLTPAGKKKVKEIATGLKRLGVVLDWVVTSPLVRAVETAEIVAESLAPNVPMDFCDALRPGGSAEALVTFLARYPNRKRVLVAGHEPDLSMLAARLIGAGRHANLAFKKGGCCLVEFDQLPPKSPGQLLWWATPRLLRKVG